MKTLNLLAMTGLILSGGTLNAQLADGLNGSSYNGLWGLDRQPASLSLSKNKLEVNLVQFFADVDNSYLRLQGNGSFQLFGFDRRLTADTEGSAMAGSLSQDRSVTGQVRFMGPSVGFRIGKKNMLAVTTGARAAFSGTELDGMMRFFGVDTISFSQNEARQLDELRFRSAALAWSEVGLNYGRRIDLGLRARLHAGISAKYTMGAAGMYARSGAATLSALTDSTMRVEHIDVEYGTSDIDALTDLSGASDLMQGSGYGIDLGFVFEWDRPATWSEDSVRAARNKYLVRLGVSVTDIGWINFKNGSTHRIANGAVDLDELNTLEYVDQQQAQADLSSMTLGDANASRTANTLRMQLPTMVHASLDVNPWGCLYLNMSASLGIDQGLAGVLAPSSASVTARVETRHFELGVPLSFHQFRGMRLGLALRAGPLMIGSDKLGGLFGLTDVGGMDVYVGLKVNIGKR
ncbi:MAG: hypothetical protein KDB88_09885 [Flavobacteriales bacterium]|nr:hypothetical protein [Flavobacteriales bacterium]